VPKEGPIICKDEIEDWSSSEANLFEEAFDKIGKDFWRDSQSILALEVVQEHYRVLLHLENN